MTMRLPIRLGYVFVAFAVVIIYDGTLVQTACSRDWFVARDGKPTNVGTAAAPFDLVTALKSKWIKPGNTVWVSEGTYKGLFTSSLTGTREEPIIVRAAKGSRVTIDGGLDIRGLHNWIWGLEVTDSDSERMKGKPSGLYCIGEGTRLINLVVHDCVGSGIGFWGPVQDGEVYGCIIYHNGSAFTDHGIYTQNEVGTKRILDNIIFDHYGWGIHAYTEGGSIKGFHIEGNIFFNRNPPTQQKVRYESILIGGKKPAERVALVNNYTYHTPEFGGRNVRLHYSAKNNKDLLCRDNYFMGGATVLIVREWEKVVLTGNTLWGRDVLVGMALPEGLQPNAYGWDQNNYIAGESEVPFDFHGRKSFADWKKATGFDGESTFTLTPKRRPVGLKTFIRPNRYDPDRIHLAVYNWERRESAPVDLSSVLKVGERFKVVSVQNYFGKPVLESIYTDNPVALPVTQEPTGPEFGAFIVEKLPL
jgi:hypothetical protein